MDGARRSALTPGSPERAAIARSGVAVCLLLWCALAAAQDKQELRYTVPAASTVSVVNGYGSVSIHSSPGSQVLVSATPKSAAVRVQATQSGSKVDIRSVHARSGGTEAVDYDVQVPPDASLLVRGTSGSVRIQNVNGGIEIDADTGNVDVRDSHSSLLRVQTIDAPITVANVSGGSIHLRSVSGDVTLTNAAARALQVVTNSAAIHFSGSVAPDSICELATHSGDIDVALPASTSADVSASSVTGSVQDSFHLQPDSNRASAAGKSFAGHAGTGSATLKLRTFSGKITLGKQ